MAPRRSKASDGMKGDDAHAARVSAHNPDRQGIVRAFDITHDPANGMDAHALADLIVARQDPRLRLVISRGRIASGPDGPAPRQWRTYSGANPHNAHIHVEVVSGALGDRDGAWDLAPDRASRDRATPTEDDDMTAEQAKQLHQASADVAHIKVEMDALRRDIREIGEALNLTIRDRSKLDGVIES